MATGAEAEGIAGLISDHGDRPAGLAGTPFAAQADVDAALNAAAALRRCGRERLRGSAGTTATTDGLGQHRRGRFPQGGDGAGEGNLNVAGLATPPSASSDRSAEGNRAARAGHGGGIAAGGAPIAATSANRLGQDSVGEIAGAQIERSFDQPGADVTAGGDRHISAGAAAAARAP